MTWSIERRLADEPHHDGSRLAPGPRTIGSAVRARVRVPLGCATERLRLRTTPDAEPDVVDAQIESESGGAAWWAVDVELTMPVTNYRFLLEGGRLGRCWLNGAGVFHRDETDDEVVLVHLVRAPTDDVPLTFSDLGVPSQLADRNNFGTVRFARRALPVANRCSPFRVIPVRLSWRSHSAEHRRRRGADSVERRESDEEPDAGARSARSLVQGRHRRGARHGDRSARRRPP